MTGIEDMFANLKRMRGEDGVSLVEAALFLAIFAPLMLLGTVEISGLVYASIEVSNAAHAGAAYAARVYIANSNTALPTQAQVTAAARNDAPELVNMLPSGTQLSVAMATGCGTETASTGNTVPSCGSGTLPYVQVTTQATVAPLFQFFQFIQVPTMTSQAKINLVN
jgi:Flp pilus assembly protein TadG